MLSNQHLYMPHLRGGWMDLGRGETLINTDLNKIVNEHWDKLAFFFPRARRSLFWEQKNKSVAIYIL